MRRIRWRLHQTRIEANPQKRKSNKIIYMRQTGGPWTYKREVLKWSHTENCLLKITRRNWGSPIYNVFNIPPPHFVLLYARCMCAVSMCSVNDLPFFKVSSAPHPQFFFNLKKKGKNKDSLSQTVAIRNWERKGSKSIKRRDVNHLLAPLAWLFSILSFFFFKEKKKIIFLFEFMLEKWVRVLFTLSFWPSLIKRVFFFLYLFRLLFSSGWLFYRHSKRKRTKRILLVSFLLVVVKEFFFSLPLCDWLCSTTTKQYKRKSPNWKGKTNTDGLDGCGQVRRAQKERQIQCQ